MMGTQQVHLDFMREIGEAVEPIIKKYLENQGLTLAEITYYSSREAEEIALREIRHKRRQEAKQ
jgi:hypothetical protein